MSRKGRPSLSLQTLINRVTKQKHASKPPVSLDEAQYASHVLERNRERGHNFRDATMVGTLGNPARRVIGNAAKGFLNNKAHAGQGLKGRLASAGQAVAKDWSKGQVASDAIQGGLVGAGLKTVQDGLGVGRARRTANRYLAQNPNVPASPQNKLAANMQRLANKVIKPAATSRTPMAPIVDELDYEI